MSINIRQSILLQWVENRKIVSWVLIIIALCFAIISSIIKSYEKLVEHTTLVENLNYLFNVNHGVLVEMFFVILMVAVIILCVIIALFTEQIRLSFRYYWLAFGVGILVVLIAKSTPFFHRFLDLIEVIIDNNGVWIYVVVTLLGAIVLAIMVALTGRIYKFFMTLPYDVRKLIIIAGSIYFMGAFILENVGEAIWFITYNPNLIYEYLGSVEEFAEMSSIIILQYACICYYYEKLNHEV